MTTLVGKKAFGSSMPQGTVPLFFIQIVSTLSFSVLYSTLVLFMKGKLGLSASVANSIMGVFVAFNFGLHLLGGYWGGRFFSNRLLFSIGMIAQIIGCIFLSFSNEVFLYYGLAAFLTGSGLNVTCVNCMLTQLFKPEDTRRETAFLWNYAGMNIGFFIGFSMSGYFQLTQNYQRLFLLSSIGNLIALLICLFYWKQLGDINTTFSMKSRRQKIQSVLTGSLLVLSLPFVLSHALHHAQWANKFVLLTGLLILALIIWLAFNQASRVDRDKLFAFSILMIIGTVFWTLYQIAPMGLTHFIDHNVQRQMAGWIIPPQWFQNINTISIVIGGPLLSLIMMRLRANGMKVNIPTQFALALALIGIAFVILPVGISRASEAGLVNPGWIAASFVLQSVGELLISPIGYAMIGLLAPASLQGVMMGMWMLSTGVGATLASYSSNWMTADQSSVSPLVTNAGYSQVFMLLGLLAIAASFILLFFIPRLRRLMNDEQNEKISEGDLAVA